MKKSLVALAVLAASGAAMAQSTVTLYGWLDTYLASSTTENKGNATVASVSKTVLDAGSVNGNRWGLKGSEDLGGGLKANFDLQSGFSQDTGASAQGGLLFGRQAWVGFSGGFGAVRLGRSALPFYDAEGGDDVMMNSGLSAQSNVFRTANGYNNGFYGGNVFVIRGNNTVRYDSPNVSGFVAAVSYSMDEKAAPAGTAPSYTTSTAVGIQVTSASLVYKAAPLGVTLAYQSEKPYLTTVPAGNSSSREFLRLSGQYDFGTIVAKAGYGKANNVEYADGASTKEYQIGLDYKASQVLTLSGGFATSKDASTTAAPIEVKRSAYTLGGKYSLSTRTFLYGGYESGKAEKAGSPDAKQSLFAIGVNHNF